MGKASRATSMSRLANFPPSDEPATVAAHSLLAVHLGDAIQQNAFSVAYQPQFELRSGRGCGVEALARWLLPTGERVAPSQFVPLAERTGMIHPLGAWMLKAACEDARKWCGLAAQPTTLSVNVSALQIDGHFLGRLEDCLQHSGFPAEQLELEITETALIGDTNLTMRYLKRWKELGVQIALDDFGTGYSSLSYLSRLPIDRLKLDKSLVCQMTTDKRCVIIIRSIIAIAEELGIDVLAEGIETEAQLAMITDLGCSRAQGYLLGRPMPAEQVPAVLGQSWGNRPRRAGTSRATRALLVSQFDQRD